jgi:hypothetical protein
MRILNKLIYADSYIIPANSIQEIHIPNRFFNEYIINNDYSHENFDIQNIKRVILIKRIGGGSGTRNIFFYSLINFDFIKENKSIFLKDIKEKTYRIYIPDVFNISDPIEFLTMTIQNTDSLNNLNIYLELRELNAVLL